MDILKLKNKHKLIPILYIIVFIIFITVRVVGIHGDMLNTDAERWHRRSENFLEGLKQGNYKETYQRYHPGVTLMWFNAVVKYVSYKYQLTYTATPLTLENADYFVNIHAISKVFNIFVFSILLGTHLYFLRKLFNDKTALIYGFLLSIEPYFLAINRWFHQTSFEVFFGFGALLTGIGYLLFLALFIFIFSPALWVDPLYVWNEMYGSISSAVTDNVRADMLSGLLYYLYYPIILVFKLSPITLILSLVSLWYLRKSKDFNVFIFIVSLLNYYVFLTIAEQKIDRYALIFIPFIVILVSVYLASISTKSLSIYLAISSIFLLFVSYIYHPVYSAYYSPLLGGTEKALELGIYDNSGEYFSQAALYMNKYGRDVYTYVPDGFSSFNLLYKGKIQRDYTEYTSYVIRSYDMQRLVVTDARCKKLVKSFGPKNTTPIVYIWGCD